jgi:small-conductance mechanosensitive channel
MIVTVADWISQNAAAKLLVSLVLLVLAAVISSFLRNKALRNVIRQWEAQVHLGSGAVLLLLRIAANIVWLVALLLILGVWGVNVTGMWTLLASAAAVIGVGFLAVWTMISNVTASIFITIWSPFKLGQMVEIVPENLKGRVVDRNMMFTVLRDGSDRVLHVPNNLFFQKMFWVTDEKAQYLFEFLERESGRQPELSESPMQQTGEPRDEDKHRRG